MLNNKQCHALELLINHAENPKEIVDALITKMVRGTRIETILRLMCLFSVTQSGLKSDAFENLKRTFLLEYGYQEVATLCNLENAALFRIRDKVLDWGDCKEKFKLIEEDVDIRFPKSYSYVFGGLKPLSIKFIETVFEKKGFRNMGSKLMGLIPGPQVYPEDESDFFEPKEQRNRSEKKKVLLYFLGGVTFAEIGAIRYLNDLPGQNVKYFIATTQIINGNSAVSQMRTALNNNLDPLSII